KEFEEKWVERRLEENYSLISGQHLNSDEYTQMRDNGNVPYFTGPSDFTNQTQNLTKWVLKEGKIATKGDILITVKGNGVGTIFYLELDKVSMGRQLMSRKSKNGSTEYLFHKLQLIKGYYVALASGNRIPGLSRNDILKTKIFLPDIPEQQKIASFLTVVDQRIQLLQKKEAKLEEYKKGVMQKLCSQEIRIKDENGNNLQDWEEKRLGEITKISTGSSNRQDSGLDGEYTFFDRSEDIRKSNIYLFDGEAVIVPGEGQNFKPKYFIGKFDLHQRTYAIMDFNYSHGKFIFYYLIAHKNHFLSQAVGSTVKSLRLPMFQKMKINLPSLQEQQKIASFLSTLDQKIEQVGQQIEKSQAWKKGLLQKMFV